jgi:predicted lipoprotein with Yx(FWY)xxD motif
MKRLILPALVPIVALIAAGCGGNSSSPSGSASTPSGSSSGTNASAPSNAYGAAPAQTPASTGAAGASVVSTGKGKPGTFLVDAQGRTLYLWAADTGSSSTCSGECASDWPPLLTKGAPKASGGAKASLLGTTKRADGTLEVTYAGHPLYTFEGDKQSGQATGQGSDAFGADWWVVTPAGKAIKSGDQG